MRRFPTLWTPRLALGPRRYPGKAGAVSAPQMGGRTEVRLAAGTYPAYAIPANSFVLPQVGAAVTLSGWLNDSAANNTVVYGCTLDAAGAQWSIRNDAPAGSLTVMNCDFTGVPINESVRVTSPNTHIIANRFAATPGNHHVKFFTDGAGTCLDNEYVAIPGEDHIQVENSVGAVLLGYNRFTAKATEDAIDIKPGAAVEVVGHDFNTAGFTNEAVLSKNTVSDHIHHNRFRAGAFLSVGAGDGTVAVALVERNMFDPTATLRMRQGSGSVVRYNSMTGATFQLGTGTPTDFPAALSITGNNFRDLTVAVNNASSACTASGNAYLGSTTGTFPGGNG